MLHGLVEVLDDSYCEDQIKIFSVPVLFCCRLNVGSKFTGAFATAQFHTLGTHGRGYTRHEGLSNILVNEQGLHGIADSRTLDLGIDTDFFCLFVVGAGIDKGMADTFVVFDDRNPRIFTDKTDQSFTAARDDQVNFFFQLEQFENCCPIGGFNHLQGGSRESHALQLTFQDLADGQVGVNCFLATTQDHGVAAL